jgi:hypothetical protein
VVRRTAHDLDSRQSELSRRIPPSLSPTRTYDPLARETDPHAPHSRRTRHDRQLYRHGDHGDVWDIYDASVDIFVISSESICFYD